MKFFKYLAVIILFISAHALALTADFDSIKAYHHDEIEQLLQDYTLEESLKIRVELKRKDESLAEEEVVSIPGLYQKTGNYSDADLDKVLNLYERKIVLIKKREVSDEEMQLVKTSLRERLYLPEDVQYTLLDDLPKIDEAVSNLTTDFFFGAYSTLVKKGQFLWILIVSLGLMLALWVLAKVWKSKSDNSNSSSELSLSGDGPSAFSQDDNSVKEEDYSYAQNNGVSESDLETFNFKSLCDNLVDAYTQAPGSTAQILWEQVPDFKSQIQFYEIIKIQKDIPHRTYEILDTVFSFKSRAKSASSQRALGFNKNTLSNISVELAKVKFSEVHQSEEKVLSELFPNCADHKNALYAQGVDQHYLVLYKIFKDDFMNYLSKDSSGSIISKINDLVTFDPQEDHPSDEQYDSFHSFLKATDFGSKNNGQKTVNNKVIQMLYKLSEEDLSNVKALKESEDLKTLVPRVSWINFEDTATLKSFLTNLDGHELKLFLRDDDSYSTAISSLDDRTQFRLKEKAAKGDQDQIDWANLRGKIKLFYSYKSNKDEFSDEKKVG